MNPQTTLKSHCPLRDFRLLLELDWGGVYSIVSLHKRVNWSLLFRPSISAIEPLLKKGAWRKECLSRRSDRLRHERPAIRHCPCLANIEKGGECGYNGRDEMYSTLWCFGRAGGAGCGIGCVAFAARSRGDPDS